MRCRIQCGLKGANAVGLRQKGSFRHDLEFYATSEIKREEGREG